MSTSGTNLDLTDVLASRMVELGCEQVRVVGEEVWCVCPFHDDRNPSFSANAERGANCFSCEAGFKTADAFLAKLADKVGATHQPLKPTPSTLELKLQDALRKEEDTHQPLDESMLITYAKRPDYFEEHWGVHPSITERRGLVYDALKEAGCFPIRDSAQRFYGVVERMKGPERSIYRYPSGFNKKRVLLGEDYPKREEVRDVWLVEGVRDLCVLESRTPYVGVALGGAKASEEQLRKLRSYDSVTLCLDDDPAGWRETKRLMRLLPISSLRVAEYDGSDPGNSFEFESFLALLYS